MNVSFEFFASRFGRRGVLVATACLGLGLSSCASERFLTSGTIDPSSPIADQVPSLEKANQAYPTFATMPAAPVGQKALEAWGKDARQIEKAGGQLEQATGEGAWTLSGTDRFAARALREIEGAPAFQASTAAETEAFARALRKRATPPPPPKR